MSRIVAFGFISVALAFCAWLASSLPALHLRETAPAILAAGGLFTVAIAVLIRD